MQEPPTPPQRPPTEPPPQAEEAPARAGSPPPEGPGGTPPAGSPPPEGSPAAPRWGEPGYRGAPDPDRQGRLAVAWILGVVGAIGLAVVALGGFAIFFALGQRQPAPVGGEPFPTAPPATAPPSTFGDDPSPPTTAPGAPPQDTAPFRSQNAFYSIRVPDGFQDATGGYRGRHPGDRDLVQALAGAPGSAATPATSIVISRLPSGADRGRPLERLVADRVRALQAAGAGNVGPPRQSTIGADPDVEVDLTVRSGGQLLRRTQVLCRHDGRVWEIAVTSPAGARDLAEQAWSTVKTGWQWR